MEQSLITAAKAKKRLELRIRDFEATVRRLQQQGSSRWKGYKRPGSTNRKGGKA